MRGSESDSQVSLLTQDDGEPWMVGLRGCDSWFSRFNESVCVMANDLASVLAALYASEINAGLASFWDGGFEVWIGDRINGIEARKTFPADKLCLIPAWLDETARSMYPNSGYVKRHVESELESGSACSADHS